MIHVGILSMQRICNYGSFLQAYGLKKILEDLGCQVQFVDYHIEPPIVKESADSKNKIIRKWKKGLETFYCKAPWIHKVKFIYYKQFFSKKYLPLLGISKKRNYTPKLDCLIIGSDEVFNCIQKNTNVGYSLELFGKNNKAKKVISYAASFGNTTLDKLKKYKKTEEIGLLLKNFDAISIRDKNSENIVSVLTEKRPEHHLDPVMIYDYMHDCNKISRYSKKEKYLLLYAYSGRISDRESDWIVAYAKKRGLRIYALGGIQKCANRFIICSPWEVLTYFENAEEVITDTFHGSVFSIITHKQFVTLIRKSIGESYGNEEKIKDLLQRMNLEQMAIYKIEEMEKIIREKICYKEIDILLKENREKTKLYLLQQLKEVIEKG